MFIETMKFLAKIFLGYCLGLVIGILVLYILDVESYEAIILKISNLFASFLSQDAPTYNPYGINNP